MFEAFKLFKLLKRVEALELRVNKLVDRVNTLEGQKDKPGKTRKVSERGSKKKPVKKKK